MYAQFSTRTYLASIGVRSTIRHTDDSRAGVLQRGMDFVVKLLSINRASASPCARWVARLKHEVWDDPVEGLIIIITSLSQSIEVPASLHVLNHVAAGRYIKTQLPWVHGRHRAPPQSIPNLILAI